MLAAIQNSAAEIIGISRTFLDPGGSGKADVQNSRMLLGRAAGGAVRLSAAGQTVTLVEGIEDGIKLKIRSLTLDGPQSSLNAITGFGSTKTKKDRTTGRIVNGFPI